MGRILDLPDDPPAVTVSTDASLLMRVLCNMILNALEATPLGGRVRFRIELTPAEVSFSVWNAEAIPAEMVHRLFVRNFSTKSGPGRGVGTYSMKLFGEQILGGRISFTTSTEEGTTFTFVLPA